jgi:hypothetical protein
VQGVCLYLIKKTCVSGTQTCALSNLEITAGYFAFPQSVPSVSTAPPRHTHHFKIGTHRAKVFDFTITAAVKRLLVNAKVLHRKMPLITFVYKQPTNGSRVHMSYHLRRATHDWNSLVRSQFQNWNTPRQEFRRFNCRSNERFGYQLCNQPRLSANPRNSHALLTHGLRNQAINAPDALLTHDLSFPFQRHLSVVDHVPVHASRADFHPTRKAHRQCPHLRVTNGVSVRSESSLASRQGQVPAKPSIRRLGTDPARLGTFVGRAQRPATSTDGPHTGVDPQRTKRQ